MKKLIRTLSYAICILLTCVLCVGKSDYKKNTVIRKINEYPFKYIVHDTVWEDGVRIAWGMKKEWSDNVDSIYSAHTMWCDTVIFNRKHVKANVR